MEQPQYHLQNVVHAKQTLEDLTVRWMSFCFC